MALAPLLLVLGQCVVFIGGTFSGPSIQKAYRMAEQHKYAAHHWQYGEKESGPGQDRGNQPYPRPDDRIKADLCERLMHSLEIDASEVSVDVRNGTVTLEGIVPEPRMKSAIEHMADSCPGVSEVENKLRVSQPHASQDS